MDVIAIICCMVLSTQSYFVSAASNQTKMGDDEVTKMIKVMLTNYERKIRPNYTGDPVKVQVDASVMSFGKLDTLNMAFTLDMFFRQTWKDHRLRHNLTRILTLTCGTKHPADIIWVPDTVFINSMKSTMHSVTVNNHKLDIYPNGQVFWGTRVTVSPSCKLNLRSYPMDTQHCKFEIVSYAHVARDLIYSWKINPGIKILDKTMSQFELTAYQSKEEMVGYVAGRYSMLTVAFTFKRLMGHSILQIYIPCVAVVCVSWISLWIDRKSTPARVALCITTLLTVATLWGSANSTLPRVNYIKAVDVYLLTSFVFVLCTLIEYVLVLNCENIIINRRKKKKHAKKEVEETLIKVGLELKDPYERHSHKRLSTDPPPSSMSAIINRKFTVNGNINKQTEKTKTEAKDSVLADYVENVARALFLIVYMVFNCVYWAKYRNSK
ncbi:gamma-aminobutyric acid receptor subunit beta-1-like isoform X2 [Rhopilema esculentum]